MKEVFEVRARWPKSHPLAGEVRKIGNPLPSARCARMVLMSGAQCTVTFCDVCLPSPDRLPEFWEICMSANAQELDAERRTDVGLGEQSEDQHEACVDALQKMVVDLPIAVLSIHRWEEDDEFAARTR
jgi:hypothetical protein